MNDLLDGLEALRQSVPPQFRWAITADGQHFLLATSLTDAIVAFGAHLRKHGVSYLYRGHVH